MITVRIVAQNEHYNSLLRQLPEEGLKGFHFTTEELSECDVIVVLDYAKKDIHVTCYPENVWLWNMEPPDEEWEWLRKGYKHYSKIITVDWAVQHSKIINHQLAIPWQIEKTYQELFDDDFSHVKTKNLSFITSNYAARKGHRNRLEFLNCITGQLNFDLWGRGFRTMEDKAVGLLPYKYTIVVENSIHKDYWSEKLADAYLCGCLPFYYGCPNVSDYFEEGALIPINIKNPKEAIEIINKAIANNEWEKRRGLIDSARQKILNQYQFFPTLIKLIRQYGVFSGEKKPIHIPMLSHHNTTIRPLSLHRNYYLLKKLFLKKQYLDLDSPLFGFTTYK